MTLPKRPASACALSLHATADNGSHWFKENTNSEHFFACGTGRGALKNLRQKKEWKHYGGTTKRPLLCRRAPIVRSVTQIPFGHLSFALEQIQGKCGDLWQQSANWGTARTNFKAVLNFAILMLKIVWHNLFRRLQHRVV